MARVFKAIFWGALIGIVGLLISFVHVSRSFEEDVGLGLLFKLRGVRSPPSDVVVVSIDNESSEHLNVSENPDKWPRSLHARLRHFTGIDEVLGYTTRDMISLPMKRSEGDPIGVLNIINKRHGTLDKDDLAILTIISALAATAIAQARLYEEAKFAEVVKLLGNIGHDVKNMLTPVLMGATILQEEIEKVFQHSQDLGDSATASGPERCRMIIEMLRSSAGRIQDRVKEIADCVKGLSSPPQFAGCKLSAVVQSVFHTLQGMAKEKRVALRTDGLETLPTILADEGRLFNALYNLVNNSIPEVPAGGSITISGSLDQGGTHILLNVTDTGRGMPPNVRDSLFSAAAISRKVGGTGLGTKIVKDVIEAHGGTISVESAEGVGTTFQIRLPICPPGVSGTSRPNSPSQT